MFSWFRYDSPVYRKLMLFTNLIIVNFLWVLTCLPVITAGAATSALYHVIFQLLNCQEDEVVKPFFQAFRENFRQATLIWVPHLFIGLALAAEAIYLSIGSSGGLWLVFVVLAVIYLAVSSYIYPIIARYQSNTKKVLMNSAVLSIRHLFSSVCMVLLNTAPFVLLLRFPRIFWNTSLFWTFLGFSLAAYLNSRMLMNIFKKYEPTEAKPKEVETHV